MSKAVRILLVEDEPSIRYVAERQFQTLGYRLADMAEDGVSAVKKALATDFDLIFMDVRLPGLDGLSATRRIREAGKSCVIVGMTAFAHRDKCLDAGMDDFVQKPVLLKQLDDVLSKWVNRVEGTNPAPSMRLRDNTSDRFQRTEQHLSDLRERIHELRRRAGLE